MEVSALYAIIETGGTQFRVEPDMKLSVPRISAEENSTVKFDRVLFLSDDEGKAHIGAPHLEGASVEVLVVRHFRGKKVYVFKRKRRKGSMKKTGHRQGYTEIVVQSITPG